MGYSTGIVQAEDQIYMAWIRWLSSYYIHLFKVLNWDKRNNEQLLCGKPNNNNNSSPKSTLHG
jgi:hypothetical protein